MTNLSSSNTNTNETRSTSSASDDPTKKRMTHLTMRLKNVFRISHPPSSVSTSTIKRPLSCVIERPNDGLWDDDQMMEIDMDAPSLIDSASSSTVSDEDNSAQGLMILPTDIKQDEDDLFEYEQQTQWVNTAKHWYSDYIFPFHKSNEINHPSPSSSSSYREGILKTPQPEEEEEESSSILGKRQMTSSPSSITTFHHNNNKKKKRMPVIRFDKMVQIHATYSQQDYNRQSDPDAICTRLNATLAHQIKQELNLFKTTEMPIHEQSRVYTHFFF
ncbi:uncharacterized protein BX664DRAFT_354897 [Halteromyces radiatus]|uniref:uncharacterized protein n=1 Tax=Halteromyces radiatus TaxID=101107 RepID=UPI002221186E|nr:uncharacterized protein BX664DRAFT_354897 [Halteromyces radiatus]KAI8099482.1 hypothetical protein BX664DRAFT_354897 [Halteromyces radiatus]